MSAAVWVRPLRGGGSLHAPPVTLACPECGKRWTVSANTKTSPECPRCGGTDWDVQEDR